ncbi:glycosyltransferase family 2 protein [Brevibacillus sp. MER 51]|uniref:glycosyltransferase family 2 protein n=1 Tax=Brevibacillus sp. MER 51 TaxID=2939560 RepID=UPI00203FA775|nr:glycosyltransferase family 2 protein [Brevibacillus sp. MER 51]MCM3141883.1 glycosyltransferase [Brevibacillus sp. MER 51]
MSMQSLPLVSVITPSYNQAKFIKRTIDSVLTQDYPHIEHIVVDGASTDGTQNILQQYSHLGDRFRFVSEPDRGQSHAVNKGLQMARGEIIGWLNSDDTYFPGAIRKAVTALQQNPDWGVVYGKGLHIDENDKVKYPYIWVEFDRKKLFNFNLICQPAAFLRKHAFEAVGGVNEEHDWCMDYDLWNRISLHYPIGTIPEFLANSRLYDACKTFVYELEPGFSEILKTSVKHHGTISNEWLYHYTQKHYKQGAFWFLNKLKAYHAFGPSPQIIASNRYPDAWAPQNLRMTIEASHGPMHALLFKGSNQNTAPLLHFHVMRNGKLVHKFQVTQARFQVAIPIASEGQRCEVSIFCSQQILQSHPNNPEVKRSVSYHLEEVLPLSYEEYQFYQEFTKGKAHIENWVNRRVPSPRI